MDENQTAAPLTRESLGELLKAARLSACLSLDDTARKLLLSPSQLEGLESGNIQSFYSSFYYLKAATKYLQLLNLEADLSGLQEPVSASVATVALKPGPEGNTTKRSAFTQKGTSVLRIMTVSVLLLGAISTAGFYVWKNQNARMNSTVPVQAPAVPEVAAVSADPQAVPNSVAAAPVSVAVAVAAPAPAAAVAVTPEPLQLKFSFSDYTWVRYKLKGIGRVEKTYSPKETLSLKVEEIVDVLIGNPDSTHLALGDHPVAIGAFVSSGSKVAHITGADLKDRTPTP